MPGHTPTGAGQHNPVDFAKEVLVTAPMRSEILEDLDQFRIEVREWLEANCPQSQRQPMTREDQFWGGRRGSFPSEDARIWYERMRHQLFSLHFFI